MSLVTWLTRRIHRHGAVIDHGERLVRRYHLTLVEGQLRKFLAHLHELMLKLSLTALERLHVRADEATVASCRHGPRVARPGGLIVLRLVGGQARLHLIHLDIVNFAFTRFFEMAQHVLLAIALVHL